MSLSGKVCLVTGASRGIGRGIALGLGEAGAKVIVTGRGRRDPNLPGSLEETAAEITRLGGEGIAVVCDHADDDQVKRLVESLDRIDVLVNNAFAVPEGKLTAPFWELPIGHWDTMIDVGLRCHYVATHAAAPGLIARRGGLVVNVSSFGGKIYAMNVPYGVGKAGVDRMSRDMAKELRPYGVTVVSLWPGIVKTERVLLEKERLGLPIEPIESPIFSGRAVVALASDPDVLTKHSGSVVVVADLAREYGFTDVDGTVPPSMFNPSGVTKRVKT